MLIDTLATMDPEDSAHCLVCISLVESILEDPSHILRRQLDKLKDQKVQAMKAEGVSYEDRMMELEQLEHPKPDADFMYHTYNQFAQTHPWLASENIRPKVLFVKWWRTSSLLMIMFDAINFKKVKVSYCVISVKPTKLSHNHSGNIAY